MTATSEGLFEAQGNLFSNATFSYSMTPGIIGEIKLRRILSAELVSAITSRGA
ncbi:hypothetical protein HMI55_006525 [Coelomomyces lativittatus]|nr:hypothetical protein HMI55_006525 [Coelomomyces lativittatus]